MLLNNFKSLISWNYTDKFTNVKGEIKDKRFLLHDTTDERESERANNHTPIGGLCFNYDSTTVVSQWLDEQSECDFKGLTSNNNSTSPSYAHTHYQGLILFVGEGTEKPDFDNYKLETPLNLASPFGSCYHNGDITTVTRCFTNNTESPVTINEVGLYVVKSGYTGYPAMVGRKVLKTPVTLQPNEGYVFTYQITLKSLTYTDE